MKKFSTIRKIYEQEITITANLPQEVTGVKTDNETETQTQTQTQTQEPQNQDNKPQENQEKPQEQPQENQPQENQEPQEKSGTAVSFFSKLFESREMAHIYHLQVNGEQGSHAAHTALNDYYESILEFIDDLIETYQGQYGIVDGYDVIDTNTTRTKDKVEYFEGLVEYIKHGRKTISDEDTHLHNIIDEIIALIYKTLYKLKFTK